MMNHLFHLFAAVLFVLSFSGLPKQEVVNASNEPLLIKAVTIDPIRSETEEYIPWLEDRRLSWDDFMSEPKRNTDAVASTSTALGITYQVKNATFNYEIACNFSKVRSWGLVKTPYILAHEQAHFDITEIFARKLHKALLEYNLDRKNYKQDINDIYQTIVKQKEAFQWQYDGETDHSRNRNKQQLWLAKIDQLLLDSEPYADYP